jgi:hypothetical protein
MDKRQVDQIRRKNDRASTHWTRLFGDEERTAFESPVAERVGGQRDRKDFSVRRCVFEQFHLVERAWDDLRRRAFARADDHPADGDFLGFVGHLCLPQRFAHEIIVASEIDGRWQGGVVRF